MLLFEYLPNFLKLVFITLIEEKLNRLLQIPIIISFSSIQAVNMQNYSTYKHSIHELSCF